MCVCVRGVGVWGGEGTSGARISIFARAGAGHAPDRVTPNTSIRALGLVTGAASVPGAEALPPLEVEPAFTTTSYTVVVVAEGGTAPPASALRRRR